MIKKTLIGALMGCSVAFAAAQQPGGIDAMTTIPSEGIKVVESGGRVVAMSSNGRFVFKGDIYDAWGMRALTSIAEINDAASRVDLKALKIDVRELHPVSFGAEGKPSVTIFVDPHCPYCKRLLDDAGTLSGKLHFDILPIGILGKESSRDARLVGCSENRDAALRAILSQSYSDLKEGDHCDVDPLRRTLVTAQMIGVAGVPFVIAPDGTTHQGVPEDLAAWLAAHGG